MKMFLIALLCLNGLLFNGDEPDAADFELSLSYYNHAGQTVYDYRVEGNKLKITSGWLYADSAHNDLGTVILSPSVIATLQSIKLDALENYYLNNCILITSGNEYFISAGSGRNLKQIHLHHYYKEEIAQLVAELNKLLPIEDRIDYVDKDTSQNCP